MYNYNINIMDYIISTQKVTINIFRIIFHAIEHREDNLEYF